MRRALALAAALLVLGFALASPAAPPRILVAGQSRVLEGPAGSPLALPTDVAVTPDGAVWVADGVNCRLVRWEKGGDGPLVVRHVAGKTLVRPTGLDVSDDGTLWLADAGRKQIFAIAPDGAGRVVPVDPGRRLDPTDLAVAPDGKTLWLVDNDRHRLLKGDLEAGTWEPVGGPGEAWGQLNHPFMATAGPEGEVWVTDALNGRVQGWDDHGHATSPVGRYGVHGGQFHRPKGIAWAAGRLWVADGSLEVVQVFGDGGPFFDVLRDAGGAILRFDTPIGVAVSGNLLYVVEAGPGRVREFVVTETFGKRLGGRAGRGAGTREGKGRECTACHLELMPSLVWNFGTALIPRPPDTAEQPWVSREEACLGCHDGTVMDSRREVWVDHGHETGQEPAEGMQVPESLPLVEGKLACRTCHSPHTLGGSGQPHRETLLLRVSERADELCFACHGESEGGHPLGELDDQARASRWLPDELTRVGCMDCHSPHGVPVGTSSLLEADCAECHLNRSAPGKGEHPVQVRIREPEVLTAIDELGWALGPGGRVVCLTCHPAHEGGLPAADRCTSCHGDHGGAMQPVSGRGDEGCIDCHPPHRGLGRGIVRHSTPGDPTGCLSCHTEGGRSTIAIDPQAAHPLFATNPAPDLLPSVDGSGAMELGLAWEMGCLTCHDSHSDDAATNPRLFRLPEVEGEICLACHPDNGTVVGTDHDHGGRDAEHGVDTCLGCHGMHTGPTLPSGPSIEGDDGPESEAARWCMGCHAPGSEPETTKIRAWGHPKELLLTTAQLPWSNTGELPLYDLSGDTTDDTTLGTITCLTCHDPHRWSPKTGEVVSGVDGDVRNSFLRDGWQGFCSGCHGQEGLEVYGEYHDPDFRLEMQRRKARRDWPIYQE